MLKEIWFHLLYRAFFQFIDWLFNLHENVE